MWLRFTESVYATLFACASYMVVLCQRTEQMKSPHQLALAGDVADTEGVDR